MEILRDNFARMEYNGYDVSFDPHSVNENELQKTEDEGSIAVAKQPVHLRWDDLSFGYEVKTRSALPCLPAKNDDDAAPPPGYGPDEPAPDPKTKMILHGISGAVRTGQMLAIMGASGAGKTTLLNLLAGRVTSASKFRSSGQILLNGRKRNFSTFKKISAYVMQDDDMFADLTVEEQITFSSLLRLPANMPKKKKLQRVQKVIQELSLNKVKDTKIGNQIVRGVSGGERKRVNIGIELVTDPSLIFLDEPTTGLDAFNALNVMATLRRLAYNRRTVVSTIHQPRSNIFVMFDYLLLLSEGRTMYFGPAADARTYFAGLNYVCPPHFNPADFFIDLLSVDARLPEAERNSRARVLYVSERQKADQEWEGFDSKAGPGAGADIEDVVELDSQGAPKIQSELRDTHFQTSWVNELVHLCLRNARLASRERVANTFRAFQTVIFSVILGLIWLNAGREDDPGSRQSLTGILFFILINQSFGGVFSVIFNFPLERSIITRERASGTYRVSSYWVAKTVTEMPRTFLFNFTFSIIVYWMVGLREEAGSFFLWVLVVYITTLVAESMALAISILAADPQAAAAVVPVFMIIFILFGGFFISSDQIQGFLRWFRWCSFVNYSFSALAKIEFNRGQVDNDILFNRLGVSGLSVWENIAALVGIFLFFRLLGYLFLRFLRGPKFDRTI